MGWGKIGYTVPQAPSQIYIWSVLLGEKWTLASKHRRVRRYEAILEESASVPFIAPAPNFPVFLPLCLFWNHVGASLELINFFAQSSKEQNLSKGVWRLCKLKILKDND